MEISEDTTQSLSGFFRTSGSARHVAAQPVPAAVRRASSKCARRITRPERLAHHLPDSKSREFLQQVIVKVFGNSLRRRKRNGQESGGGPACFWLCAGDSRIRP